MLEITKQIEKIIIELQIDRNDFISKIENLIKEKNVDININYIDARINDINNDGTVAVCVWLVNHYIKENGSNDYKYFSNHGEIINIKRDLNFLKLVNCYKNELGEHKQVNEGYYIKECLNNKPSHLMTFKSKDFLCFAAFNGYNWITFTLDDYGKDNRFELIYKINYSWRKSDAANVRKNAQKIVALYVDHQKQLELNKKIAERGKNRDHDWAPNYNRRYTLKDLDGYNKNHIALSWVGVGTYPYYKYKSCNVFDCYDYIFKIPYETNDTKDARNEIIKNCFDKSGYFLLKVREDLKRRADALRNQRALDYYKSIDKASYIGNLKTSMFNCEKLLKQLTTVENVKTYGTKKIDYILSCIKHHEKVLENINNYRTLDDLKRAIKQVNNEYLIILTQYKNSCYSWADPEYYTINDNKVVARWGWVAERNYINICEVATL